MKRSTPRFRSTNPMTHWKLTLAYIGSGFHGWQIQPGLVTVQGTLAEALRRITGEHLLPQGAGRTDTGVHARGQVASFALHAPVPAQNLHRALNRVLPAGVRVLSAEVVPESFHARHSARGKFYEYRLFERRFRSAVNNKPQERVSQESVSQERVCSPFLAPFVWDCRWPLDLQAMQTATQHLIGTHDFSAMAATNRNLRGATSPPPAKEASSRPEQSVVERTLYSGRSGHKFQETAPAEPSQPNPIKTIHEATWTREDDLLIFRIRGNGFLHHMVRNVVGTLVDIGRGSLFPEDLPRILDSRNRALAGPTAPASGLYLVEVFYPSEIAETPALSEESIAAGVGA